jgi:endoglucanase
LHNLLKIIFVFFLANSQLTFAQTTNLNMLYKGMNIAGAEFNRGRDNAKNYKDYIWPTNANLEQMKTLGFNTIRVPFAWERMQPSAFSELDKEQLSQLDRIVQQSHMLGLNVILDPHSYGQYKSKFLEANQLDIKIFADLWSKLASRYGKYPNVIFGLMNEPHAQTALDWSQLAQAGVNAIRKIGATHLILVPGTIWSGMYSWQKPVGELSNAQALLNINDPLNNYAYEMHQYFDKDNSGTHQECISSENILSKFERTTLWLKENNKKAFLGEFGVPENDVCIQALKDALDFMKNNQSQWIGWAYWTAGDWMARYPYNYLSDQNTNIQRFNVMKNALTQ